jgi:hypothetical protein
VHDAARVFQDLLVLTGPRTPEQPPENGGVALPIASHRAAIDRATSE